MQDRAGSVQDQQQGKQSAALLLFMGMKNDCGLHARHFVTIGAMTTYTTALPQWGIIRLAGADAAQFIHNQLTQDFLLIKETQARLAAWCSPKGRVLVSFYGWRPSAEEVLLLCPADSIDYAIKRLSMFVLRS